MRLPYRESAVVALEKVDDYLLSLSHPEGRAKARFFMAHGFTQADGAAFVQALLQHGRENDADLSRSNKFGSIYTVKGPLLTPDARNPLLRTVWIIETESTVPRLITAYPTP